MNSKKSKIFLIVLLLMAGCAPLTASLRALTSEQTQIDAPTPAIQSTDELPGSAFTETVPNVVFPWKTYYSDSYGFSFFYPAVYDKQQYETCAPKIFEQPDGTEFSLGHQSFLHVQRINNLDLQAYVENLVAQKQAEGSWLLEVQNTRKVAGEEAIEVSYRFGGTNRFGTATFLIHKDLLLTFNFYAGAFCDVPEADLTEGQAYAQWIDSLHFDN